MVIKYRTLDQRLAQIKAYLASKPPLTQEEEFAFLQVMGSFAAVFLALGTLGLMVATVLTRTLALEGFDVEFARGACIISAVLIFSPTLNKLRDRLAEIVGKERIWLHQHLVDEAIQEVKKDVDQAKFDAETSQVFAKAALIAENPHLSISLIEVQETSLEEQLHMLVKATQHALETGNSGAIAGLNKESARVRAEKDKRDAAKKGQQSLTLSDGDE